MIDVHYWPTPNGKKVTILLEELGMPYRVVPVNIGKGDQFTDGFRVAVGRPVLEGGLGGIIFCGSAAGD